MPCIYLAEFEDSEGNAYVKIGKANNAVARLASIQVACPFELSRMRHIPLKDEAMAYRAERAVQIALMALHVRGEWFCVKYDDAESRAIMELVPLEIASKIARSPVKVYSLSMSGYQAAKSAYQSIYWNSLKRKSGRMAKNRVA